ncbi:MAG: CHAT domain-containing protein, partial [Chitinophagaceae bacterium]
THAEYNNVHPERSGLLFSKNIAEANENNFLTLYDVYNCDMRSNLTLLTACESGRHGYQDGEGMISLAHAFNYAGSQRILTALWKIDEQSSSQITESLITNLKDGMDTDEALRQAKLKYIREARGRTVAPAYWAGLVIMGEPAHIAFQDQAGYGWWIFVVSAAALVLIIMLMKYFSRKSA